MMNVKMHTPKHQNPPSAVLCIKTHDMKESDVQLMLQPFSMGCPLPLFIQSSKGLCFAQLPSVDLAMQVLSALTTDETRTPSGKLITAEYSTRTEVVSNNSGPKRPLEATMVHAPNMSSKRPFMGAFSKPAPLHPVTTTPKADAAPSPVLCIRSELAELELLQFLSGVGTAPVDSLELRNKGMIFVQFPTVEESTKVKQYLDMNPYATDNSRVNAQFSTRQCIEKKEGANGPDTPGRMPGHRTSTMDPVTERPEEVPSKVVLIRLRSSVPAAPINVDNLLLTFSRCGVVEKVIVSSKKDAQPGAHFQALMQFSTADYASLAKERFNASQLGTYKITIHFSDRDELDVTVNNERMRDFTNPWLETEGTTGGGGLIV